jgi:hypothetical protein
MEARIEGAPILDFPSWKVNMVSNRESEGGSAVSTEISVTEARLAPSSIERRRQQVIDEIDLPSWYRRSLAAGWVGLGVLAELAPPWATIAGTVAFGAVHSAVAPRVLSGRHGSPHMSIRRDMVNRYIPLVVVGFLVAMTVVTVALAPDRQRRRRTTPSHSGQRRRGRTRPHGWTESDGYGASTRRTTP